MSISQVSSWFMIFVSGLWAGVILTFWVERTSIWARMPIEEYAIDFRRSVRRVDPMQPILALIAAIAAALFAWRSHGPGRDIALIGLALVILVVIASIVIAEPINSAFRRLPEGQVPAQAERHRTRWRQLHSARTVAAVAAFACFAAAVVW